MSRGACVGARGCRMAVGGCACDRQEPRSRGKRTKSTTAGPDAGIVVDPRKSSRIRRAPFDPSEPACLIPAGLPEPGQVRPTCESVNTLPGPWLAFHQQPIQSEGAGRRSPACPKKRNSSLLSQSNRPSPVFHRAARRRTTQRRRRNSIRALPRCRPESCLSQGSP